MKLQFRLKSGKSLCSAYFNDIHINSFITLQGYNHDAIAYITFSIIPYIKHPELILDILIKILYISLFIIGFARNIFQKRKNNPARRPP